MKHRSCFRSQDTFLTSLHTPRGLTIVDIAMNLKHQEGFGTEELITKLRLAHRVGYKRRFPDTSTHSAKLITPEITPRPGRRDYCWLNGERFVLEDKESLKQLTV